MNGKQIATHNEWQEPFEVKLTNLISFNKENHLAIFVEKNVIEGDSGFFKQMREEYRVGIFMEIYLGIRNDSPKPVSFEISEKTCGFDKKYTKAKVNWSYPENKKNPVEFNIGETWGICLDPSELRVLELTPS